MPTVHSQLEPGVSPVQAEALLAGVLAAAKAALPQQGLDVLVWGASRLGDQATLRHLLASGGGTSWTYPMGGYKLWRGSSCLWAASRAGHEGAVKELLESGVDVDEANTVDEGSTPLHVAALQGHEGVVEQLVNAGVDVNKGSKYGGTPLQMAAFQGHEGVVEQLLKAGAGVDQVETIFGAAPLHMAAREGHEGVVEQLVKAGVDVDKADTIIGSTPLHQAADRGHEGVVGLLLKAGANPNAVMNDGRNPLIIAAEKGHSKVCSILLKSGANVDHDVADHGTALKVALTKGFREVALILMENGASCDGAILVRAELEHLMRWSTEALKEEKKAMKEKDAQMERLVQGIPEWCAQAASAQASGQGQQGGDKPADPMQTAHPGSHSGRKLEESAASSPRIMNWIKHAYFSIIKIRRWC